MLTRGDAPAVTVVVPVFRERARIPDLMATLEPFVGLHEIVIVDGGSDDGTYEALLARGVGRVIRAPTGRAPQLNAGAAEATGHVLLFLHADTEIEHELPELALKALDSGADGGCFSIRIRSRARRLRLAGRLQTLRSKVLTSATGDQAIFVRRDVFADIGGFSEAHSICEDIEFVGRFVEARGAARFVCLDAAVTTSARRWEKTGINRTIALMWGVRLAYHLGASPRRLADLYDVVR